MEDQFKISLHQQLSHVQIFSTSKPSTTTSLEAVVRNVKESMSKALFKYNTLHVQCTKNNTIACLTDQNDRVITTTSAGMCGLKNSRKKTPDSGYVALVELIKRASLKSVDPMSGFHVKLKGFGIGRDQAFRAILASGWRILRISDVTPHRHKGCRPPKKRRL